MGLANMYKDRKEYEKSLTWHQKARDILTEGSFGCSLMLLDDAEKWIWEKQNLEGMIVSRSCIKRSLQTFP